MHGGACLCGRFSTWCVTAIKLSSRRGCCDSLKPTSRILLGTPLGCVRRCARTCCCLACTRAILPARWPRCHRIPSVITHLSTWTRTVLPAVAMTRTVCKHLVMTTGMSVICSDALRISFLSFPAWKARELQCADDAVYYVPPVLAWVVWHEGGHRAHAARCNYSVNFEVHSFGTIAARALHIL